MMATPRTPSRPGTCGRWPAFSPIATSPEVIGPAGGRICADSPGPGWSVGLAVGRGASNQNTKLITAPERLRAPLR
jgi:hypothetical protein